MTCSLLGELIKHEIYSLIERNPFPVQKNIGRVNMLQNYTCTDDTVATGTHLL